MSKRALIIVAAAAAASLGPSTASASPIGPYAGLCAAGKPAVLARVSGFKAAQGVISVKLYPSDPDRFLAKGGYVRKVELPVNRSGPMDICVPVPANGRYALAVRHEIGSEKSRSDGGGFSGNPSVSLIDLAFKRKPAIEKVSFSVEGGTRIVPVTLKYLQGGAFRPVAS